MRGHKKIVLKLVVKEKFLYNKRGEGNETNFKYE